MIPVPSRRLPSGRQLEPFELAMADALPPWTCVEYGQAPHQSGWTWTTPAGVWTIGYRVEARRWRLVSPDAVFEVKDYNDRELPQIRMVKVLTVLGGV